MATANRAIKARPKATPDRIQENISNSKVIKQREIVDNQLVHIAETEDLSFADLPAGDISVPLNLWLDHKQELLARKKQDSDIIAVQVASDEAIEDIVDDLNDIDIIVLPFVTHADGRAYSHAQKLRSHYGFQGEIRAVGDVHYDQLWFLSRVGCDAFELPEGDDYQASLGAFNEFSEVYQPASDDAHLIYSRRRAIH